MPGIFLYSPFPRPFTTLVSPPHLSQPPPGARCPLPALPGWVRSSTHPGTHPNIHGDLHPAGTVSAGSWCSAPKPISCWLFMRLGCSPSLCSVCQDAEPCKLFFCSPMEMFSLCSVNQAIQRAEKPQTALSLYCYSSNLVVSAHVISNYLFFLQRGD